MGTAQGSILGPDLWNASYDVLLRLKILDDAYLVGYANDVAAVITSLRLNEVMCHIKTWM